MSLMATIKVKRGRYRQQNTWWWRFLQASIRDEWPARPLMHGEDSLLPCCLSVKLSSFLSLSRKCSDEPQKTALHKSKVHVHVLARLPNSSNFCEKVDSLSRLTASNLREKEGERGSEKEEEKEKGEGENEERGEGERNKGRGKEEGGGRREKEGGGRGKGGGRREKEGGRGK